MLKKIVKTTFITLTVALIIVGYSFYNLKHYSVFYAKHTPHKSGVEPVLMELVDNLWWIENPEIPGIKYDFDGPSTIYNKNYKKARVPFFSTAPKDEYHFVGNNSSSYLLDRTFGVIVMRDRAKGWLDPKSADVGAIKQEIYKTVQPVIDAQPKPSINLQWLYDHVNKEKFN